MGTLLCRRARRAAHTSGEHDSERTSSQRFRSVPATAFLQLCEDASSPGGRQHSAGKRLSRLICLVTSLQAAVLRDGSRKPKDSLAQIWGAAPNLVSTDSMKGFDWFSTASGFRQPSRLTRAGACVDGAPSHTTCTLGGVSATAPAMR